MMLLRLITWPYLKKHALRTALTAAGVVLGVAVFVGMHAANQSVLLAFAGTIDRIAGKTNLQITAGEAGFGEDVLEKVQSAPGVQSAVPVIEAVVDSNLPGQGDMLVLATDMTGDRAFRDYDFDAAAEDIVEDPLVFLAQPDSIIVSKDVASRNGLTVGSPLPLRTVEGERRFVVRGIMKPAGLATAFGGNLLIMDVYAAQKMFGRGRTFDRIDVTVKPGASVADVQRGLKGLVGAGFNVDTPATRGQQAAAMVAGYTTMVDLASVSALVIGMFIIYNSFATAVAQRRSEIGILRCLGASRAQIRSLFLAESFVLGLVGSAVGLGAGMLLARAVSRAITELLGQLYGVAQQPTAVATNPVVLLTAAAIGVATSVVAAFVPARNAALVDPVQTLNKGSYEMLSTRESRWRLGLAAVCALLAAACLVITSYRPLFFAGYALTIATALLLVPLMLLWLAKALRPLMKRWRPVEGVLAVDSLIQAPRRTSGTVAALTLSLALIVAFAGMARASYGSVVEWMNSTLNADLFVMPSERLDLRTTRFPASMAGEIAGVEGVERVQMFRNNRINFQGRPVMVAAVEMNSVERTSHNRPVAGDAEQMYQKAAAGAGVIVSDNLAQLDGFKLGDPVELDAPYGTVRLPIVGIIVDYVDQQGTIFVDRQVFLKYWRDDSVSDFRLFLKPDASSADVRQRIIDLYAGKRHVFVLTNEESRRYVLRVAGQWFALMNVQIAVAVLVAVLGIVNTLTVSIADRRRELAVLQAIGGMRRQIRRTIWLEALSITVIGLILGSLLGSVNLYYLLQIVQHDVIGMRLDYQFPVLTILELVPIMLAAAFVAALLPAEAAVRAPLVRALEYE
jgi:putative ABC transport system permease protein